MPEFTSERSIRILGELHPALIAVCRTAIKHVDFSLIEGHRETYTQRRLFVEGKTKLDGVNRKSKHQETPAKAFDFIPIPFTTWDDRPLFTAYAFYFIGIGAEKGIDLTWGGDWDNDFNWRDQSFHDLPHIELRG